MTHDSIDEFREWREARRDYMWSDQMWPRSFWFDAFLSHRRSDWSRELAAALGSRGVRAYHDNDVAVRDKQVEFELHNALQHSRFVIACLTPEFGNSLYGRLEYLPALKHSASVGVPRVIVARREHDVVVPAELIAAPVFDVRDDTGVDALAAFVTEQNRVAFPQSAPAMIQPADVFPKDGAELIEQLNRVILGSGRHRKEFALREVGLWAQAVLSASMEDILAREQALGLAHTEIVKNGIVSPDWHDYVWRCAFVLMHAPQGDPALVGTEVFLWAARHGAIPDERQLIIQRVWFETSNGRPGLCARLLDRLAELPEPKADAIERAVVTYPSLFSDLRSHLVSHVSSAARVKVGAPGLDEDQLPPSEAIHLIRERVLHLQQAWIGDPHSVGLFDVDGVLRELRDQVRDEAAPRSALIEVYERSLESKDGRPPLVTRLQLPELVHLVYLPLGDLHAADPSRIRPLLTAVHRATVSSGFRHTEAVISRQLASDGPFVTEGLYMAISHDSSDERRLRSEAE